MREIEHIFFDLDHTLWDYDRNAHETLEEVYALLELSRLKVTFKKFINTFYEVNNNIWHKYNNGLVDRDYIRERRFELILEQVGADANQSGEASDYFMTHCSTKPHLMPDALTALNYLNGRYRLHIITNGFQDPQKRKLDNTGITNYFDIMVTSECADARKPSYEIFEYSLLKAGAQKRNSIMIGDNPRTDIMGARDFGLKTVLYDPSGKRRALADYFIQSHMELLKLF